MEINLKDLSKKILYLKQYEIKLFEDKQTRDMSRKIKEVRELLEEIESDLEINQKSELFLDKDLNNALEERNKMLQFIKDEDI